MSTKLCFAHLGGVSNPIPLFSLYNPIEETKKFTNKSDKIRPKLLNGWWVKIPTFFQKESVQNIMIG